MIGAGSPFDPVPKWKTVSSASSLSLPTFSIRYDAFLGPLAGTSSRVQLPGESHSRGATASLEATALGRSGSSGAFEHESVSAASPTASQLTVGCRGGLGCGESDA